MHTFPFYCEPCNDVSPVKVEFPTGPFGVIELVCHQGHRTITEDD